jgi:hypothetical protein
MNNYKYLEDGEVRASSCNNGSETIWTISGVELESLVDSGVDITAYVKPEKTKNQLRGEVKLALKALDSSPRLIEGVLLGDQESIDTMSENEGIKIELRKKLKAI